MLSVKATQRSNHCNKHRMRSRPTPLTIFAVGYLLAANHLLHLIPITIAHSQPMTILKNSAHRRTPVLPKVIRKASLPRTRTMTTHHPATQLPITQTINIMAASNLSTKLHQYSSNNSSNIKHHQATSHLKHRVHTCSKTHTQGRAQDPRREGIRRTRHRDHSNKGM